MASQKKRPLLQRIEREMATFARRAEKKLRHVPAEYRDGIIESVLPQRGTYGPVEQPGLRMPPARYYEDELVNFAFEQITRALNAMKSVENCLRSLLES